MISLRNCGQVKHHTSHVSRNQTFPPVYFGMLSGIQVSLVEPWFVFGRDAVKPNYTHGETKYKPGKPRTELCH